MRLKNLFKPKNVGAQVGIIADSVFEGIRNTTWKAVYWRAMHGELKTHRDFTTNSSSSRARPSKVVRKQVLENPAGPIEWLTNQKGMVGGGPLSPIKSAVANFLWFQVGAKFNAGLSWCLEELGVHKQFSNRCLEPWEYIHTLISATETANFYKLRDEAGAQPEMRQLAQLMRKAQNENVPRKLSDGEWHLPFVTEEERATLPIDHQIICSTARSARTTFADFDGSNPSFERDQGTYHKLVGVEPMHMSPSEHPSQAKIGRWANMINFRQHRWQLEGKSELPPVIAGILKPTLPVEEWEGKEMYPHYYVNVEGYRWLDFYEVARLFGCVHPELQHAIKKILPAGKRNHKNLTIDIREAIQSLQRFVYQQNPTSLGIEDEQNHH
ncbi:MAG: hypothetical protein RR280_01010 [Bacteroidaceae bacterium]